MLEYLYTGATDCMAERAPELLQIAEKYDLADLKEDCGYALAESLNKDNAPMIWSLANALNVPFLIQRTQDFAYLNKVGSDGVSSYPFITFIKMKVPLLVFAGCRDVSFRPCVLAIYFQEEKDSISFLWVVNNFSSLSKLPEVKSPVFRGGPKHNYGW
ncbi:hypothetical protein Ocin01_19716 [Orchesella cincta]|uniref:MATH domain-containing protein n=1 Tax=Orchesella cincta TaxID=48709 RepID=A0A1D2M1Y2_ORCCI|nr:hypothetical protein Ocin01_19716 [Orchesella cincta]